MSEFQIERPQTPSDPSRSVDSSDRTDSEGGGGTTFLFHGGGDGKGSSQQSEPRRPPLPIEPPVSLSLSSAASSDIGRERPPGDFGSIGPVLPPLGIAGALARGLAEAKSLSEAEPPSPEPGSPPGSLIDLKA